MRILHYSLGFPPYRTGGLTKFCMDLMKQQVSDGNEVALMWPGSLTITGKTKVKDRGYINSIQSFEVINPLPVPYDEGIIEFKKFTSNKPEKVYIDFLRKYCPDIIHIHTLMGMHDSFLSSAKKLNIRMVFTAHDFFPLCPKVKLFSGNMICQTAEKCVNCPQCNITALKPWKIVLLQSSLYRYFKDNRVVKILRRNHRKKYLNNIIQDKKDCLQVTNSPDDYLILRKYYLDMLSKIDCIHYNSSVTREVYERFQVHTNSMVFPITHGDICDHRKKKEFGQFLRITFLGSDGGEKGFFCLKGALDKLWLKNKEFSLNLFFVPNELSPYMKIHDKYSYIELEEIFDATDILIAPSMWCETFGFTVLEALSFGVPVLISDTVGAKDILVDGGGIVIEDITEDKLEDVIEQLNSIKLQQMNATICDKQRILEIKELADIVMKALYQEIKI